MSLKNDFLTECKKSNWHFDWFKSSSMKPLLAELDKTPANKAKIASAIQAIDATKRTKYKPALDWLSNRIGLAAALNAQHVPIGVTTAGYQPAKATREKDRDGGWHDFERQAKGNSCGPTCVRIVIKAYTHLDMPMEKVVRQDVSLHEHGAANTGVSSAAHDWANNGSNCAPLVKVLTSRGVKDARTVTGASTLAELKKASKNNPAIMGWWWGVYGDSSNGGHWTVCVGPTKDGQSLIILDPWNGVQHVQVTSFNRYLVDGQEGWFNPNDPHDPAVIVTHAKT